MAERLATAMREAKVSNTALSQACDVSVQAVGNWKKTGRIDKRHLPKIAELTSKPIRYFLQTDALALLPGQEPVLVEVKSTPIVGTTQAGPDVEWAELGYPAGYGDAYVTHAGKGTKCYALRVLGDSMAPRMMEGDCVVCDPDVEPYPGLEVVAKLKDGTVMVKRLAYVKDGEVAFDSIGHGYGRIVRPLDQVEFMHTVVSIAPPGAIARL